LENKRAQQDLPGSWGRMEREKVAQIMYTHASKCRNDNIKKERKIWWRYYVHMYGNAKMRLVETILGIGEGE
jgi:hypothetical protein